MCTGLRYMNDSFYFGRNLDLDYTFGQSIVITPKNYEIKFKHEKKHYQSLCLYRSRCSR